MPPHCSSSGSGTAQTDANDASFILDLIHDVIIRELSEPLIPVDFYQRCYDCIESPEESIAIVSELPDLNKRVLRYIVRYVSFLRHGLTLAPHDRLCRRYLRQQILLPQVVEITRMDEDNLATIFAPSIFRPTGQTMADMIVTMSMQSQFLCNLLRYMTFPPWGSPDDEDFGEDQGSPIVRGTFLQS